MGDASGGGQQMAQGQPRNVDVGAAENLQLHSFTENICSLDDFEIKAILGQGSSGTVYKAYQKYADPKLGTGQKSLHRVVALKEVKIKETISKRAYKEVINEVEMMKKIKHPNIVQLYDSFIDRQFDTAKFKRKNESQAKEYKDYECS